MSSKDTSVQSVSGSYGLYKGVLTVTKTSDPATKTKFSITGVTKMQQASGWGVETVVSGAVSGSAAGYAYSPESDYTDVPGTKVSKTLTVNKTKNVQTKTIYIQSRGKSVDGWGAAYSQTSKVGIKVTIDALPKYKITYDANQGSDAPNPQYKWHGENITLTTSIPSRSGYTFLNWNTKSNGTGTSYAKGATFKANAATTLYAIWKNNGGVTPPASYVEMEPIGIPLNSIYIHAKNTPGSSEAYRIPMTVTSSSPTFQGLRDPSLPALPSETAQYRFLYLSAYYNGPGNAALVSADISKKLTFGSSDNQKRKVLKCTVSDSNISLPQSVYALGDVNKEMILTEAQFDKIQLRIVSESSRTYSSATTEGFLGNAAGYAFSSLQQSAQGRFASYVQAGLLPMRLVHRSSNVPAIIFPGLLYADGATNVFNRIEDNAAISAFADAPVGTWSVIGDIDNYDVYILMKLSTDYSSFEETIFSGDASTPAAIAANAASFFTNTLFANSDANHFKIGFETYSGLFYNTERTDSISGWDISLSTNNGSDKYLNSSLELQTSSSDSDIEDVPTSHVLSVTYHQAQTRSHWQPVVIERAPDRDSDNHDDAPVDDAYFYNGQRRIYWDSINDVLGELVCFGHYNTGYFDYTWDSSTEKWIQGDEHPGTDIYNIYRQVFQDDQSNPYDEVHIRAYAAIPDPNKELQVGYLDNGKWVGYNLSDCRIGFIKWSHKQVRNSSDASLNYRADDTTITENENSYELLGGIGGTPGLSAYSGTMYQYFRSTQNIDESEAWPEDGRPAVGAGTFGNQFATPEDGKMPNRICLTLPSTLSNTGFQQSPLIAWTFDSTSDHYVIPNGAPQYIRCYDADGQTKIADIDDFPKMVTFPVVVGSKTSSVFNQNTLRCVDPIDANDTDDDSSDDKQFVFSKAGADYLKTETYPFRYSFCYVYTNPLGHTLASQWRTVYANLGAEDLSTATGAFRIMGWVPENTDSVDYDSITGVDIFYTKDDYKSMAFAGHQDFPDGPDALPGRQWVYDWYGASSDTTEWSNAGLTLPDENTTRGPECEWMDYIDNKCYFYGGATKHRLYIGGRVGHELCTTNSTGGGWLDINPGSGVELKKVLKFKTYNGANIVTMLASHANHRLVRRYNLIENNMAISNEMTSRGYAFEEVSNVVGAISHWGAGVWAEGLYTLSRYGLHLTTQQMENTNNLRAQLVSNQIAPLFTESIAKFMHRSEMIFSDEKVYFVLSTHDLDSNGEHIQKPSEIVFCYDVGAKGWYTYTIDNEDNLLSVFNFDFEGNREGIGIVTPSKIYLVPNGGVVDNAWPEASEYDPESDNPQYPTGFNYHSDRSILETGELALRTPPSSYQTLSQLEFRFDYFIGKVTIDVTGVDYYGRHFNVQKVVEENELKTELPVYMRIDKLLQTYNIRIDGYAHYRLTHILAKTYPEANKIDLVYGFDSDNRYEARPKYYIDETTGDKVYLTPREDHKRIAEDHHCVRDYNNLRECIVP